MGLAAAPGAAVKPVPREPRPILGSLLMMLAGCSPGPSPTQRVAKLFASPEDLGFLAIARRLFPADPEIQALR